MTLTHFGRARCRRAVVEESEPGVWWRWAVSGTWTGDVTVRMSY